MPTSNGQLSQSRTPDLKNVPNPYDWGIIPMSRASHMGPNVVNQTEEVSLIRTLLVS